MNSHKAGIDFLVSAAFFHQLKFKDKKNCNLDRKVLFHSHCLSLTIILLTYLSQGLTVISALCFYFFIRLPYMSRIKKRLNPSCRNWFFGRRSKYLNIDQSNLMNFDFIFSSDLCHPRKHILLPYHLFYCKRKKADLQLANESLNSLGDCMEKVRNHHFSLIIFLEIVSCEHFSFSWVKMEHSHQSNINVWGCFSF